MSVRMVTTNQTDRPERCFGRDDVVVVVPTLNAAETLAQTLRTLTPAPLIISDASSFDDTVRIARDMGAKVVTGPRGRGQQLGAGARAATHPWLLFLHADTQMSPEAWVAVDRYLARPDAKNRAGNFDLRIDALAWQARWIERAVAIRVRLLGLPYGDQGLLIHRDLYDAIGGFHDLPLMEDVDIARRLGRSRITPLGAAVATSAVRWKRRGWMRQTLLNLTCVSLFLIGVDIKKVAKIYGR